ncbi:MAG: hypothetical protein KBC98_01425 [Candidatus Pacebacteria bacterium]|nr:hypothetical protein [Candidatus Paceibacterota bacterium]
MAIEDSIEQKPIRDLEGWEMDTRKIFEELKKTRQLDGIPDEKVWEKLAGDMKEVSDKFIARGATMKDNLGFTPKTSENKNDISPEQKVQSTEFVQASTEKKKEQVRNNQEVADELLADLQRDSREQVPVLSYEVWDSYKIDSAAKQKEIIEKKRTGRWSRFLENFKPLSFSRVDDNGCEVYIDKKTGKEFAKVTRKNLDAAEGLGGFTGRLYKETEEYIPYVQSAPGENSADYVLNGKPMYYEKPPDVYIDKDGRKWNLKLTKEGNVRYESFDEKHKDISIRYISHDLDTGKLTSFEAYQLYQN